MVDDRNLRDELRVDVMDLAARIGSDKVPKDLLDEAMKTAEKIAGFSLPATMMAKEAINRALEAPLAEGLRFEKRLFHALFATEDQKEGMAAFAEKRPPAFRNR